MIKITELKTIVLKSLMSNDLLFDTLILKGGNALELIYEITDRASTDIDFSLRDDYNSCQIEEIKSIIPELLNQNLEPMGYSTYDFKMIDKPKNQYIKEWKGYQLSFKIIPNKILNANNNQDTIRRNAVNFGTSTNYTVDISCYEYTERYEKHDFNVNLL